MTIMVNKISKKDHDNNSDEILFNPQIQFGIYLWGLVGATIANQVNNLFIKDSPKAEN